MTVGGQTYNGASNMMEKHSGVFLPKSAKGNQVQLQHIAKAIRWV